MITNIFGEKLFKPSILQFNLGKSFKKVFFPINIESLKYLNKWENFRDFILVKYFLSGTEVFKFFVIASLEDT